jgi:hypothetical protein
LGKLNLLIEVLNSSQFFVPASVALRFDVRYKNRKKMTLKIIILMHEYKSAKQDERLKKAG